MLDGRRRVLAALLTGVALALFGAAGCGPTCSTSGQKPIRYTDGVHPTPTSYLSTPWTGPWLYFPPGRTYDLVLGLGGTPSQYVAYVAFSATPVPTSHDADGNWSQSAGNQTIFEQVNSDFLRVRNDTCSEFYLLVSAVGPAATDGGVDATK